MVGWSDSQERDGPDHVGRLPRLSYPQFQPRNGGSRCGSLAIREPSPLRIYLWLVWLRLEWQVPPEYAMAVHHYRPPATRRCIRASVLPYASPSNPIRRRRWTTPGHGGRRWSRPTMHAVATTAKVVASVVSGPYSVHNNSCSLRNRCLRGFSRARQATTVTTMTSKTCTTEYD
jgi:hypothetical protein